ncbi:MAG: peroxide stress protein YaaA [Adlercreutzia sp.]|nr:peroxide stress protein YaaA [Adlercreutzia sp.]
MKIIISPAKKMTDKTVLPWEELPTFIHRSEVLLARLRELSFDECKTLWGCSQKLAEANFERLRTMDLRGDLAPALLSYVGIQYQYMGAAVLDDGSYDYLQEHLRILSGFYGVLRPFYGVTPYRLEMQAKLAVDGAPNLYEFWGSSLYDAVMDGDRTVVDLASVEYSKCVSAHLREGDRFLKIVFGELINGKVVQKGTLAKMARGEMVRFMAANHIEDVEDIKEFAELGYRFAPQLSNENEYVFLTE